MNVNDQPQSVTVFIPIAYEDMLDFVAREKISAPAGNLITAA
jgi:hypothetical protein